MLLQIAAWQYVCKQQARIFRHDLTRGGSRFNSSSKIECACNHFRLSVWGNIFLL